MILALTFVLAPLPNAVFSHCGGDDFSGSQESNPAVDFGRFVTSIFVVTGFALPIVWAHSEIIDTKAALMSVTGGGYVPRSCGAALCSHSPYLDLCMQPSLPTQQCSVKKSQIMTEILPYVQLIVWASGCHTPYLCHLYASKSSCQSAVTTADIYVLATLPSISGFPNPRTLAEISNRPLDKKHSDVVNSFDSRLCKRPIGRSAKTPS